MSDSIASIELRQYLRGNISESQLLTVEMIPETGPIQRGVLLNISEGGLALQLFRPVPVGSVGNFCFRLPESDTYLVANGTIAWAGPCGHTGVCFINPSAENREQIRQWLGNYSLQSDAKHSGIPAFGSGFRNVLQGLAERVNADIGATGAAIAVGDSGCMECFASVGSAPGIGTPLDPNIGLSGLCVRTGTIVHCRDASTDARVDASVAEQLHMRSAAILPIHAKGEIAAVFEVFSSEPNAFLDPEVMSRIELFAEAVTEIIECSPLTERLPQETDQPSGQETAVNSPIDESIQTKPAVDEVGAVRDASSGEAMSSSKPVTSNRFRSKVRSS
jgi:GAF domain-containing protein